MLKCCSIREVENYKSQLSQTEVRLILESSEERREEERTGQERTGEEREEWAAQPPIAHRTMIFNQKEAQNVPSTRVPHSICFPFITLNTFFAKVYIL